MKQFRNWMWKAQLKERTFMSETWKSLRKAPFLGSWITDVLFHHTPCNETQQFHILTWRGKKRLHAFSSLGSIQQLQHGWELYIYCWERSLRLMELCWDSALKGWTSLFGHKSGGDREWNWHGVHVLHHLQRKLWSATTCQKQPTETKHQVFFSLSVFKIENKNAQNLSCSTPAQSSRSADILIGSTVTRIPASEPETWHVKRTYMYDLRLLSVSRDLWRSYVTSASLHSCLFLKFILQIRGQYQCPCKAFFTSFSTSDVPQTATKLVSNREMACD